LTTIGAKSKSNWGREPYKNDAELNVACGEFLSKVQVPKEWRFETYDKCFDAGVKTELHPEGTITSIGAVYTDKRTRGFDIKKYKVLFLTFSNMGALVERTINRAAGKPIYTCVVMNKTAEKLSEYIYDNYHRIEKKHKYWKFKTIIKRIKRNGSNNN